MSWIGWVAVALAGGVSLVSPVVIRPMLTKLRILDVPNERSSHTRPTLRGGGVAPLLGIFLGGVWAYTSLPMEVSFVLGAAVLVSLVGLIEDLRGLRIAARAALQILIGAALALLLPETIEIGWAWVPIAAVGFAANVNFTNFMDGVNGISCLHGMVAGSSFCALGVMQETPWLQTVGLVIAVSFATFLPWNLIRPGMFLGDVGSYLLGGALGATAIAAIAAGVHPVGAFAPLSIYWADTVVTLLQRARHGESVFQSHRSHTYQRLTKTGLSHMAIAWTLAWFTMAASAVGILTEASIISTFLAILLISVLAVGYLFLPRMRGDGPCAQILDKPLSFELPQLSPSRAKWDPQRWSVFGVGKHPNSDVSAVLQGRDAVD